MRRRAAFSILELLISSVCLLLMLGAVTSALVSFGRAYHKFSVKAVQERASLAALQTFCAHLRSADCLYAHDRFTSLDLSQQVLRLYVTDEAASRLEEWRVQDSRLFVNDHAVGPVESVLVKWRPDRYLEVMVDRKSALIDWRDVGMP